MAIAKDDIQFFGGIDKNKQGKVGHAMPTWFFDSKVEELQEKASMIESRLQRGTIRAEDIPHAKEKVMQLKNDIQSIHMSRPELSDKAKDKLSSEYDNLVKQFPDLFPTRADDWKGHANVRQEAQRMKGPCVSVGDPVLFRKMNIPVQAKGKMISRDNAVRAFQIMGKLLGKSTDYRDYQREGDVRSYRSEIPLREMR